MSIALTTPSPIGPSGPHGADFLDQCAEMGKTLFTKLRSLIESPPADAAEYSSALRELDNASRVLKRVQETYLAARNASRTGCQPVSPKCKAGSEIPGSGESLPIIAPAEAFPFGSAQKPELISPCSGDPIPSNQSFELPQTPAPPIPQPKLPQKRTNDSPPSDSSNPATDDPQFAAVKILPPTDNPSPPTRNPHPPFRPPLIRNPKKNARRKSKRKR